MATVVCGKRSFFEDMDSAATSPTQASQPAYKRFRCSSGTSPVRFNYSPPPVRQNCVNQLRALFPDIETQLLEKALEESGNDLDSAIRSLHELCIGHGKCNSSSSAEENLNMEKGATPTGEGAVPLEETQVQNNLPADGAEWVDLLVREMQKATSIDDARSRAASILENLEKSITARASDSALQNFHKENLMLKEQIEVLLRDNSILKRAVSIQHDRQKEYDAGNQEVQQLKHMVIQYQEQLRTLEVKNYALSLQLHQSQQHNTIPGHYNPDVF